MRKLQLLTLILCLLPPIAAAQIIAGSPEDKAFQQLMAETNADAKLQKLVDFEKSFPRSKALSNVYLMVIEIYRGKNEPDKIIEYGEKVLTLDAHNVTAMMVLSRNYAIKRVNLDRAVELAQKAVDEVGRMRSTPPPSTQTEAQWKSYLDSTEVAARGILSYTMSIRGD
ncbi:MAG TPA: hypothetical protein VFE29_06105 [Terriglobia bacterium]|nr:hypothetical protein [Terriglobia bacterium]